MGQRFNETNVISERFPTSLNQKLEKHQLYVMDFVSHQETTLILIVRSAM